MKEQRQFEYLYRFHQEFLFRICQDSGLGGLDYFGGPEVTCSNIVKKAVCGWKAVIPCVRYKSGDVTHQEKVLQSCVLCGVDLNIREWLVSGTVIELIAQFNIVLFVAACKYYQCISSM